MDCSVTPAALSTIDLVAKIEAALTGMTTSEKTSAQSSAKQNHLKETSQENSQHP